MIGRLAPVAVLSLLAPVCAEYLAGYDDTTGDPLALVAGLVFFVPLYGGAAVLVRETARRLGAGWPGIVLLGVAFGLVQAGLADQSLFNTGYRDIGYWTEMISPTFVPALGTSGYSVLNFVGGHAVWSICVPIAVAEAMVPTRRIRPWTGRVGLGVVGALYLAATALVAIGHVETEGVVLSPGQLVTTVVLVVVLIAAAVLVRRRPVARRTDGRVPAPLLLGAGALAATALHLWAFDWVSVLVSLAVLVGAAFGIARWARSSRWTGLHALAVAGGAMLGLAAQGFATEPLGEVSAPAKYGHNTVLAILCLVVIAVALRRSTGTAPSTVTGSAASRPGG